MKTLKLFAFAAITAFPLTAQAMCGGDYTHQTSTVSICDAGQVWDDTKEACVAVVG